MKKIIASLLALVMTLGLVACGGGSEPAPSAGNDAPAADKPAEVMQIKLGSNAAVNTESPEHNAALLFCEKVAEYSNGTMNVTYYPAGQLGSSLELAENLSMGTIEMISSVGVDLFSNFEPACFLLIMPYMFESYEHMKSVFEDGCPAYEKLEQTMIDSVNARIMGWGYRPMRNIIIAKDTLDDLNTPADLAGMIIRSPEANNNMAMISAWGTSPVTITLTEVFTSMSNGTVHGAENDLNTFFDGGFTDVVGLVAETDHMMVSCPLIACNSWYESLTPEQQEVIDKASKDYNDFCWENFRGRLEQAWAGFEAAGAVCVRKDDIDIDAFRAATQDLWKEYVADGCFTEEDYMEVLNWEY